MQIISYAYRRQVQGLLHPLETAPFSTTCICLPVAHPDRVVKEFSRSAAGQDNAHASMLRPPHGLMATVAYLIR